MIKRILIALALCLFATPALAQASACPYPLQYGQVLTTAQWNACLSLGVDALPISGGTMLGPLVTYPSVSTAAGFTLTPGAAPTGPHDGDLWVTNLGLYAQINGATRGPMITSATTSPAQGDVLFYDGTSWRNLVAGTSGQFLKTLGAGANPLWATPPSASGCLIVGGTQYQIVTVDATGSACVPDTNTLLNAGALTLGSTGVPGSITFGNATSGTVVLQPSAGALGSSVISIPAGTDTLATVAGTQTLTNKSIDAAEVNSGTLPATQMPALTGDATSAAGTTNLTLANSGVTAGSYAYPGSVTVDAKGRVTSITASTGAGPVTLASGTITPSVLTLNLSSYTGYKHMRLFLDCSCGTSSPTITVSTDGGSTFKSSAYNYSIVALRVAYTSNLYTSQPTISFLGDSGVYDLTGVNQAIPFIIRSSTTYVTGTTNIYPTASSGTWTGGTGVNAIKFSFSAGFVSGTYVLVGYK